jgi:hypothetical protein
MKSNLVVSSLGKTSDIHLSMAVDTKIIFSAEMDFRSSFTSPEFIAFDQDKVHNTLFITEVSGSLDIDIAVDIA